MEVVSGRPVRLVEIDKETVRTICDLQLAPGQERFVAPNAVSIAQAHFTREAWFRAIYAGEEPVGFAMLYDDPDQPRYYLWRLMIDHRHQGRGYGRRAVELLIEYVRGRPRATELQLSVVPGASGPQGFYEGLGFRLTGEIEDGEAMMRLEL